MIGWSSRHGLPGALPAAADDANAATGARQEEVHEAAPGSEFGLARSFHGAVGWSVGGAADAAPPFPFGAVKVAPGYAGVADLRRQAGDSGRQFPRAHDIGIFWVAPGEETFHARGADAVEVDGHDA